MTRRILSQGLLTLAIAFTIVGCSDKVSFRLEEDLELLRLKQSKKKGLRKVVLAPIRFDRERAAEETAKPDRHTPSISKSDLKDLRGKVIKAAKEYAGIKEIGFADADDDQAFEIAQEMGAEILARIEIEQFVLKYKGINTWWTANLFIWWYAMIPSWYIADEEYGVESRARLQLYSVSSQKPLLEGGGVPIKTKDTEIAVNTSYALDDWERGFYFLGIFRAPDCLTEDDWEGQLGKNIGLRDDGLLHFTKAATLTLRKQLDEVSEDRGALEKNRATVHAVVAGISEYAGESGISPSSAGNDATRVMKRLVKDWKIPRKNIHYFRDGEASAEDRQITGTPNVPTADMIKNALGVKGLGNKKSVTPDDTVLVYFAGAGSRVSKNSNSDLQILAPGDTGVSGISFSQLASYLEKTPALRILVVLDCSFANEAGLPRTLPSSIDVQTSVFNKLRAIKGKEVTIIVAGGLDQPAVDLQGANTGLFTYYFLQGLKPGTPKTWNKIMQEIEDGVHLQAGVEGFLQQPRGYYSSGAKLTSASRWLNPKSRTQ